jgi:hypothetical protein
MAATEAADKAADQRDPNSLGRNAVHGELQREIEKQMNLRHSRSITFSNLGD